MTKRLIEIEDGLLDRARRSLGTRTITDTVVSALELVVRDGERRKTLDDAALKRFAKATKDLADEEVMAAAWR